MREYLDAGSFMSGVVGCQRLRAVLQPVAFMIRPVALQKRQVAVFIAGFTAFRHHFIFFVLYVYRFPERIQEPLMKTEGQSPSPSNRLFSIN